METAPDAGDGPASGKPHYTRRVFTMLENNPDVMNKLARSLGVTDKLAFYDVYSLYDADMMAIVSRPVYALLVTIPISDAWKQDREAEDAGMEWYKGAGPDEPVVWFRQTIVHGCGLIAFLHCLLNGVPAEMIVPGSKLAEFREKALPLGMDERAKLLNESDMIHEASEAVAREGDTEAPPPEVATGNHFVALVKGRDGNLWELEGSRKGPLNRGALRDDEDAFSETALDLGMRRLIDMQRKAGADLPFSCIALAPNSG